VTEETQAQVMDIPTGEATEAPTAVVEEATAEATPTPEVDPHEEKISELNNKLAEASKAAKQSAKAVDQLTKAGITSGPAFDAIAAVSNEATAKVDSIKSAIENENKKYQLQKIAQPLVDAIGEVEVGTGNLPTSLNLGDIEPRRAKAQEQIDSATATIKFLDHVIEALKTVEIDRDSWDNMKPLNIIRIPDTTRVKVAIATRAGRTAGATDGRTSSREQVTIVKAGPDHQDLIGKKIYGEGADFPSWANLLSVVAPTIEAERQAKMAAGSNSSAKTVAMKKLSLEVE